MAKKQDGTRKMSEEPQQDFIEKSYEENLKAKQNREVECLGMKFPNDAARRGYSG